MTAAEEQEVARPKAVRGETSKDATPGFHFDATARPHSTFLAASEKMNRRAPALPVFSFAFPLRDGRSTPSTTIDAMERYAGFPALSLPFIAFAIQFGRRAIPLPANKSASKRS